jgi:hypothetical protein
LIDDKPIGATLNRNLGSPTAPGEAVEGELDRLIERRSRQKDPDEELGRVCTICSHAKRYEIEGLLATRQSTYRGIARTYGVEQSELISRLDTFVTKKRKA